MSGRRSFVSLCASLLDTCASTKNLKKLEKLHALAITRGIASLDFIRSKLVFSYTSCFQTHRANLLFSFAHCKPTFLYNCLIRAYASQHRFRESLSFFRCMILDGKPIDRHTLPVVLKSCGGLSNFRLGRQVHGAVLVNGYSSDIGNCNGLISMYGKCGDLLSARKIFDEMPDRNEVSWTAMMAGYGLHGEHGDLLRLFDKMVDAGLKMDGVTFTTFLTSCSHVGAVEKARECLGMMQERFAVRPTLEHFTCIVDMLGRRGWVEEAEDVIMEMELEPDDALWRSFLGACKIHGKVEVAERAIGKMNGNLRQK